ncbi:MAG: methylenetetrahydrofolate reductase [Oscillospiraceae bacterium]|jgi:methylenetetrahydrofolate reductase (NADPH)|nr:methylenetetrahydrofolate reductase [Oscillospiraceae bacterium]
MFISQLFAQNDLTVSFEVFPPKASTAFDSVQAAVQKLSALAPHYISVTYGAGGGTSRNTCAIAQYVQNELNTTALAHLSCVSSTRAEVYERLTELRAAGIENVLALRGDIPAGSLGTPTDYRYAAELVEDIAAFGGFCTGAACYPEGHPESASHRVDLQHLREKVDSGVQFLCTQMFFDNNVLYRFLYKALALGIDVPVTAGIMPITSSGQVARMIALSGASLPPDLVSLLDKFGDKPEALYQAGVQYAIGQILDLVVNGVRGVHIYTMNKPDVAQTIMESLSEIL